MDIALGIAGIAVFAWLLVIVVYRQGLKQRLPWFVCYVIWETALAITQLTLLSVNRRWYFAVYWWMELVEVALIVAAVRESFLRIFWGFTTEWWFRLSVSVAIAVVVIYSAWRAIYAPPVLNNRLGAFVVSSEFAFRTGVVVIVFLSRILMLVIAEPMNTREDAVVFGFGIASAPVITQMVLISFFANKYLSISQYLPSVGYFAAAFYWLWMFLRPQAPAGGFKETGIGPEDIGAAFKRYRSFVERMGKES